MEQPLSLTQPSSSSAQSSVYLNDSTHNLNGNPSHTQAPTSSQSEELYKRSVMLVIWYKAHTTPLRLLHPLPTFPFLQLSQFPSLLSSLSLTPSSFVDAYNAVTAQWEQHMIETVRLVVSEQRVLYKLRKSLLEDLAEEECPGLQEEIAAQQRIEQNGKHIFSPGSLKRRAPDVAPDAAPPNKYYITDNMYQGATQQVQAHQIHQYGVPVAQAQNYSQNLTGQERVQGQAVPIHATSSQSQIQTTSSPPTGSGAVPKPSFVYSPSLDMYPGTTPESMPATNGSVPPHQPRPSSPAQSKAPIPHHPHPPLKRWPNDYSVQEVSVGFDQMDALASTQPSLTQRAAFERVFGCRYVKSTVCRHRAVWRRADEDVRDAFIKLGRDERAMWGEFVRHVEGRISGVGLQSTPGKSEVVHMQGVLQVPLRHLSLRRDEGEGTQEPVMGSLVPATREEQSEHRQSHSGLSATIAVSGPGQAGETSHVQIQHPVVYESSSSLADGLGGGEQG
ncbi:hypothetical protein B0F90DRAFT_1716204 [Multifurca ochricompacta]|uniref:Uncharacterized protein n=1 Tax=Multifurca ochricompacta TaxID=376703 RepID=A0AAD4M5P4_9AGAM|nr:hypothetical protein B0F90DRAFT_1716204 [Multifurca ochricompacta]